MHFRTIALLAVAAALLGSCIRGGEKEPNDTFDNAQSIDFPAKVKGNFEASGRDYYKFHLAKKTSLKVVIRPGAKSSNSCLVQIADGKRSLIKKYPKTREGAAFHSGTLVLSKGVYFIILSSDSRNEEGAEYKMDLLKSMVDDVVEHEEEPNDSIERASPLPLNEVHAGYFYPAAKWDKDYFAVSNNKDPKLSAALDVELSAVPGIDSRLRVLNAAGDVLIDKNISPTGGAENVSGLRFPGTALFFIELSSMNGNFNINFPYRLLARIKKVEKGYEYEPNNSIESAMQLNSGEIQRGRIYQSNDQDIYTFQALLKDLPDVQAGREKEFILYFSIEGGSDEVYFMGELEDEGGRTIARFSTKNESLADYVKVRVSYASLCRIRIRAGSGCVWDEAATAEEYTISADVIEL